MLRPLILICNDVYHPSLRPLRQSSFAEVIHMRKPALTVVALRMQSIFEKENGEWKFLDARGISVGTYRREEPKTGRNDPCPCGSGKKFKKCCAA